MSMHNIEAGHAFGNIAAEFWTVPYPMGAFPKYGRLRQCGNVDALSDEPLSALGLIGSGGLGGREGDMCFDSLPGRGDRAVDRRNRRATMRGIEIADQAKNFHWIAETLVVCCLT